MVRTSTSNSTESISAYLDTSPSVMQSKSEKRCITLSTNDVAKKLAAMLACFDGSPGAYSNAEPIIDEIYSKDLVIDHGDGNEMNLDAFKAWAATFAKERNVAQLEELKSSENEIQVKVRNIVDGVDQGTVGQVGVVRNGKIVHWFATSSDEAGFAKLISSVAANSKGMTGNIQRVRDYLAALDGSPNAWEQFEPHIDRVHSRDVVWEDGNGSKMYYDDIVALLRDQYIPNGCYAVLESVEDNQDGSLTVVINNHLPGEDGDATRQVLYYGDDDRIHRLTSTQFYETCERVNDLPSKGGDESISANLGTSPSVTQSKSEGMTGNIQRLRDYLAAIDGSPNAWEQFEPHIDRVLSRDIVLEVGNGSKMYYDDIVALLRDQFIPNGCYPVLESLEDNQDGSLTVVVSNHLPGEDGDATRQVLYYGDDDRIHRLTSTQFYETCERVNDLPSKGGAESISANLDTSPSVTQSMSEGMTGNIQRLRDYLAAIDGSPNAWEQFEPHIDRVLSRDIVLEVGNGSKMYYDDIVALLRDQFIPNGCYPVLESLEDNQDGSLTVVVNNHLPGEDGDATRQVLYYGDDDRIHRLTSTQFYETCERVNDLPSKGRDESISANLDTSPSVMQPKSERMTGNIQRLRDYLAALDGSPNAWEQFEPHIDRVLSRDIVLEVGNGSKMYYDDIVALLRDQFIPNGCYPVLESLEDNQDGSLTVVVSNYLPGEDGDATRQVLYYGDDDRIHRLTATQLYETCERINALPTGKGCED